MIDKDKSIQTVSKVFERGSNFSCKNKEDFNKCIDHIFQLITDAYTMYTHGSFSTSLFLSIAVIEEVAKVHVGMFIDPANEQVKKDGLLDHKTKEIIGVNYTISMGERINAVIASDELEKIYSLAYTGELKNMREEAIYCEYKGGKIITPNDIIDRYFAKKMLLFAIESFDDNLVGYTRHSMHISKKTDAIFDELARL